MVSAAKAATMAVVAVLAILSSPVFSQEVVCKAALDVVAAYDSSGSVWTGACPSISPFAGRCDDRTLPETSWCSDNCGHEAIMGWLDAFPDYFDLRGDRANMGLIQWGSYTYEPGAQDVPPSNTGVEAECHDWTQTDVHDWFKTEAEYRAFLKTVRFPDNTSQFTHIPEALRFSRKVLQSQARDTATNQILLFLTDGGCNIGDNTCTTPEAQCNQMKTNRDALLTEFPNLIIIAIGVGSGVGSCDMTIPCLIESPRTEAGGCGDCQLARIASPGTESEPQKWIIQETDFSLLKETVGDIQTAACVCKDNCGGHGQCFSDGTCLCDVGYQGETCSATFVPSLVAATAALAALGAALLGLHRFWGSSAIEEEEEEIYEEPEVMEDLIIEAPMMIEPTMETDANAAGAPPATDNRPMFSPASRVQPTTFNRNWKAGGATFV